MAKAIDKSKMLTDKKSFIGKCIHTFFTARVKHTLECMNTLADKTFWFISC